MNNMFLKYSEFNQLNEGAMKLMVPGSLATLIGYGQGAHAKTYYLSWKRRETIEIAQANEIDTLKKEALKKRVNYYKASEAKQYNKLRIVLEKLKAEDKTFDKLPKKTQVLAKEKAEKFLLQIEKSKEKIAKLKERSAKKKEIQTLRNKQK